MADYQPFDASGYKLDALVVSELGELLDPIFAGEAVPEHLGQILTNRLSQAGDATIDISNAQIVWLMLGSAWCSYEQDLVVIATHVAYSARRLIEFDGLELPQAKRFAGALIAFYMTQYPEVQLLLPRDKVGPTIDGVIHMGE